jgi:hypothetical protein
MANQQPTYQTRQARKPDDFWLNIGATFMHQDGESFNHRAPGPPHQRQDRTAPALRWFKACQAKPRSTEL